MNGKIVSAPIAQADGDIWYFSCKSENERDQWMCLLKRAIKLIKRCDDTRPTLSGMGSIHDHYIIGNVLGVGRFGVVREGANKHTKQLCAIKIINKKKHIRTQQAEKGKKRETKKFICWILYVERRKKYQICSYIVIDV